MSLTSRRGSSAPWSGAGMLGCAVLALTAAPAAAVDIDWVTVGDPGNLCDQQTQGCFGRVLDVYRIGMFEVTNAQYTEFLNAVAESDPNSVYSTSMEIGRLGIQGEYTYSTPAPNEPLRRVSFYDALRFANWLHNGQPIGPQDESTTENGAYTLMGADPVGVRRNSRATVLLPKEDEWYKAAYYDPVSMSYFAYPASSDTAPLCRMPTSEPNHANCNQSVGSEVDVGSYTDSASPNGTFDQGGNVGEWNETVIDSNRGYRGGDFAAGGGAMGAHLGRSADPTERVYNRGFRVATVPEPDGWLLGMTALLALAGLRRNS